MLCPNENIEMQQVKVESHYGQTVILDQCARCGGIWFDNSELYMAKQGEAAKIELLDANTLRTPTAIENSELLCPRDRVKLVRFIDLLFPKDIIIARCPVCNGFWLNRGEFTKYQNYRERLRKPKDVIIEDEKLERDIARILADHRDGDTTDVLEKLGKFLSMPLDTLTWRPLEAEKLSEREKTAFDMIMNAISLFLRLFIRI